MSEPDAVTFADALDQLADTMGGSAIDTQQRLVRRAVVNAYRRLVGERSWQYHYGPFGVTFVAPYSTGTVDYDQTGGTYERMLTFSTPLSATVQAWIKFGRIRVNGYVYEIEDYKTSSVVTLTAKLNPGADFTAQSFTAYQNVYPLPADFRRILPPTSLNQWWTHYVPPAQWQSDEWHVNVSAAYPWSWTILPDPDRTGGYSIAVSQYPTALGQMYGMYQRWPRTIKRTGKETSSSVGTVSVSTGATAVTGTTTTFTSDMVGSYLRFGDASNVPDGLGGLNPYVEQKKILTVTNALHLTLDSAVDNAYADVKYCVSDPLDISLTMIDALYRCAEWQLGIVEHRKDVGDLFGMYHDALMLAFEGDAVVEQARSWPEVGGSIPYRPILPVGPPLGV